MKLNIALATFFFFAFINCATLAAQENSEKLFVAAGNESGEQTTAFLEMILRDFRDNSEKLFVISGPGKNESPKIVGVRLRNTKTKLSMMSLDANRLVFAEDDKVKDEGRIEFYLGRELRLAVLAKHNEIPNLSCCEDYFPPV